MNHPFSTFNFKDLRPFFLGAILTLLVVIVVNWCVDVKGIYGSKKIKYQFYKNFAHCLQNSPHPLLIPESERFSKYFLGKLSNSKAFVLGSSRGMLINAEMLKENTLMNLGVSGGGFEDFKLFIGMLLKKNKSFVVYLIIDPWFFSKNSDIRYMELKDLYLDALKILNINEVFDDNKIKEEKLKNILNRDYFVSNVSFLFENIVYKNQLSTFRDAYRSDGTIKYAEDYEIKSKLKKYEEINNYNYKIESYGNDEKIVNEFKSIFYKCKEKGINFVLIELPYHPRVWEKELALTQLIEGLQSKRALLQSLSQELKVPLLGHHDPTVYGLKHEDFYDSIHLRAPALKKIFKQIWETHSQ